MLFLKYLWNTSKHKVTKVLWNIVNEIWPATWVFLVRICRYSMRVMYLLDLENFKHSLKNTVWQFKFLLLLFFYYCHYYYYFYYYYYYYYYYYLHIKQTLFFALLDRLIRLELEEGWQIISSSSSHSVKSKFNVNLSNKCTSIISQPTAKNITKWIKITSNNGYNNKS